MHNAIVILQNDATRAENLAAKIKAVSETVFVVQSLAELQKLVLQHPVRIGVLDLGLVSLDEIVSLRRQLGMEIVCTHRTADETMWTGALHAGALDCCFDDDGAAVCRAIQRTWAA